MHSKQVKAMYCFYCCHQWLCWSKLRSQQLLRKPKTYVFYHLLKCSWFKEFLAVCAFIAVAVENQLSLTCTSVTCILHLEPACVSSRGSWWCDWWARQDPLQVWVTGPVLLMLMSEVLLRKGWDFITNRSHHFPANGLIVTDI